MYQLKNDEFEGRVDTKGIVFDMPLTGLNNVVATILFAKEEKMFFDGGERMEQKGNNGLILMAVNQGHTDAVMDTARKAGARGGTVIRARWAGSEENIMEAVNEKHGLSTEAGAMICSLRIDQITKLG